MEKGRRGFVFMHSGRRVVIFDGVKFCGGSF